MTTEIKETLLSYLKEHKIEYSTGVKKYYTDSSFLACGLPLAAVFVKSNDEVIKVLEFAIKNRLKIVPRAMGSSTAGASLPTEDCILLITERLNAVDKFGKRTSVVPLKIFDKSGKEVDEKALDPNGEYYARVGAGVSTIDLDKALKRLNYHIAVVPSSGWSCIAGNYSTNAGGNGTPTYGTFKDIVNRVEMVVVKDNKPQTVTVTDKEKLVRMGGTQGILGIITSLDVRIVPIPKEESLLNVVISCEGENMAEIGSKGGRFMEKAAEKCEMINAEFLFIDAFMFGADDPLMANEELREFITLKNSKYKMLILYQGLKEKLAPLKAVADAESKEGINYKEVSGGLFKILLEVRKSATGRAKGRVAIPGFEDTFLTEPKNLGIVLKEITEIAAQADIPGRPIGHQYAGGLVIHYRPLAQLTREDYVRAFELTQKLDKRIVQDKSFKVDKRFEHGLGLELYALSSETRRNELLALKKEFDPQGFFNNHLLDAEPKIAFAGKDFNFS
ncbi:MAG: hypothetical protein Kow0090_14760 [Myxococcota bacterium]